MLTSTNDTMRAVLVVPGLDGGRLELTELPVPRPAPGQLLVRVHAAGVNRADLAQRSGGHKPGIATDGGPLVAGLDAAGEVVEVGDGVDRFAPGDRVMAMVSGGYADYVTLDARIAIPVPESVTYTEAAAAVIALMTEYDAIVRSGELCVGQAVLIHGAGSGVGRTGVQMAAYLGARPVIGTVRRTDAEVELRALGATDVLTTGPDLAQAVLDRTGGRGVDLVIDHVGGPLLAASLHALAVGGRLISVGRLGGTHAELDMELLAYKRLTLEGVTFRTRSVEQYAEIVAGVTRDLLEPLAAGTLRPGVHRTYPLEQAAQAQELMASDGHRGKIVLVVDGETVSTGD
jgi:NADPH:quinone reductase